MDLCRLKLWSASYGKSWENLYQRKDGRWEGRYNEILFNIPMGERIVVNDRKPSGLDMAFAINMDRDKFVAVGVERKM